MPSFTEFQLQQREAIGPTDESVAPPIETHWTRIFYYNLFAPSGGAGSPDLHGLISQDLRSPASAFGSRRSRGRNKARVAATTSRSRGAGFNLVFSPIEAASVLLSVLVAMYLFVALIVRPLISLDANAAVPTDTPMASSPATMPSASKNRARESLLSDSLGQVSQETDNARECRPSAGIDSQCIFN